MTRMPCACMSICVKTLCMAFFMDMAYYKKYEPFFGAWSITKLLGEGSFGKVYEIEREDFGEIYKAALKVITVPQNESEIKNVIYDGMDEESVTEYFETLVREIVSEFVLLSKLKGNSNIVSYEDHQVIPHEGKVGWDIFIRMELLTPLMEYAQQTELTQKDIINLGIDMCRALEICQKRNIIHRDIKPENIFISEDGNFKLGDFGIARTIEKTSSGLSKKGTYTYMAPEVYKGEDYNSSVDIYSLGIVMYRLLNGNRIPFLPAYPEKITHSDRDNALMRRMSGSKIQAPLNTGGRLAEIVLKACAYNPAERYSSPMQFREELEAIAYGANEAKVVCPQGDKVVIEKVEYVSTGGGRGDKLTDNYITQVPEKTESAFSVTQMVSVEKSYAELKKTKKDWLLPAIAIAAVIVMLVEAVFRVVLAKEIDIYTIIVWGYRVIIVSVLLINSMVKRPLGKLLSSILLFIIAAYSVVGIFISPPIVDEMTGRLLAFVEYTQELIFEIFLIVTALTIIHKIKDIKWVVLLSGLAGSVYLVHRTIVSYKLWAWGQYWRYTLRLSYWGSSISCMIFFTLFFVYWIVYFKKNQKIGR